MKKRIFYYTNNTKEVINFNVKKIKIDEHYKYKNKNVFYNIFSFVTYYLLAKPIAWFYFKLIKRVKFKNKKVLNPYMESGFFVYANHTHQFCDCFCPALICFTKKPHIIVNADNVSIPFWGKLFKMWGALPLPENILATKNFYKAIETTVNKNPIIIYPEEHLWPYYTKIREFSNTSFRYPVKFNKPTFTFTTVYKKHKLKKPKIEIYIDGPFFIDTNLTEKENQQTLKDKVFAQLNNRASLSNIEYVKYIKKD